MYVCTYVGRKTLSVQFQIEKWAAFSGSLELIGREIDSLRGHRMVVFIIKVSPESLGGN
jgi:hypothetical protein